MILYLDTSALVELYMRERGSARTRRLIDPAEVDTAKRAQKFRRVN